MTKIIIQTTDVCENVIAQSEKILHDYEETPYDFYRAYEELVDDHKRKLYDRNK